MAYRIEWRLLGRAERLLDQGRVGDWHASYGQAAGAVSEFLRAYPEARRSEDGSHWCARRSPDADIELRVWISDLAKAEVAAACEV